MLQQQVFRPVRQSFLGKGSACTFALAITLVFAPGFTSMASAITLREYCVRFLNQCTFGPTESEINTLHGWVTSKVAAGQTQSAALVNSFTEWIDGQFATTPTPLSSLVNEVTEYYPLPTEMPEWLHSDHWPCRSSLVATYDQVGGSTATPSGGGLARDHGRLSDFYTADYERPDDGELLRHALETTLLETSIPSSRSQYAPGDGILFESCQQQESQSTAGTFPDENYAREVMQLFSCGLYHLNDDGSFNLNGGTVELNTYDNEDITNMAKVFTGLLLGPGASSVVRGSVPMIGNPAPSNTYGDHDQTVKTLISLRPGLPKVQTPATFTGDKVRAKSLGSAPTFWAIIAVRRRLSRNN